MSSLNLDAGTRGRPASECWVYDGNGRAQRSVASDVGPEGRVTGPPPNPSFRPVDNCHTLGVRSTP